MFLNNEYKIILTMNKSDELTIEQENDLLFGNDEIILDEEILKDSPKDKDKDMDSDENDDEKKK